MKMVALQSDYLPWKGYFDMIHDVDLLVVYDDVQYTKNDWRNRNKIKMERGTSWITLPVGYDLTRKIDEVKLKDDSWQANHWAKICQAYRKAPYFSRYKDFFEYVYCEAKWTYLCELDQYLLRHIAEDFLGIHVAYKNVRDYDLQGKKLERLLDLIDKSGTDLYVSGPAAQDYIDPNEFAKRGVELVYKDYSGYPEYEQFYPPFEHNVSIIDLLFQMGPDAPYFIWGWREDQK